MRPIPQFVLCVLLGFCCGAHAAAPSLRAGAFSVDISPTNFPVRVNAMFTERSADKVVDPLFAKALALDDGPTRLVLCVVDTCMIPRDLIDRAKADASKATGIPTERMLVSATHTHSAPSAMGCLGSRVDPAYSAFLPGRITAAIIGAAERLAPARISWAQADDWEHTFNRRWIRRPDKMLTDPFGRQNVRANMHPPEKLLANILDPGADVQPGFHAYHCRLADGTELYGLIGAETGNSITFKLADGTTRAVLRASIAELNGGHASLMSEGLEAGLNHQDMADLIQFLRAGLKAP